MVCLAAVLTGLYFVSCDNKDDSESGSSSDIVGTWENEYDDEYDDEEFVMFCADGTCYLCEECSTHGLEVEKGAYIYSSTKETLSMFFGDEVEKYDVISISKTKMILRYSNYYSGGSEIINLRKITSPYTAAQLEKLANIQRYS